MNPFEPFERRWRFTPPASYRLMYEAGLLRHDDPAVLALSDTEWLTPADAAEQGIVDRQVEGLIPFAQEGRGSTWSWYLPWSRGGEPAVVHCPRDYELASGYAPTFAGAVYRLLLEEFSSSWLLDRLDSVDAVAAAFRRYVQAVRPMLLPSWSATLEDIVSRPARQTDDQSVAVIHPYEAGSIISRDLAFEHLDEKFVHYRKP